MTDPIKDFLRLADVCFGVKLSKEQTAALAAAIRALSAPAPSPSTAREVNLNDEVWVRLTDTGRAIYRKQWDDLCAKYPGITTEHQPKAEVDGWSRWQIWELASTFGPHLSIGDQHLPLEMIIRLGAHSPSRDDGLEDAARLFDLLAVCDPNKGFLPHVVAAALRSLKGQPPPAATADQSKETPHDP